MDDYNIIVLTLGISLLAVAYLPSLLSNRPLSYPIFYIGLGVLLFQIPLSLDNPDPLYNKSLTTHLTELCVIVALMGTGLRIDKNFSFKDWTIPFRLILITMILSIVLFTALGISLLELPLASALLLGAALAPTDPVLASDIQVGPPGKGKEDAVRFSLTSEAGLNDGMAFPFIYLAVNLLTIEKNWFEELSSWFLIDVIYKVGMGIFMGWLIGKLMGFLIFQLPKKKKFHQPYEGFVALAITLVSYGATELIHAYGFLAVFITAIVFRDSERDHQYHSELHNFTDQFEKLFLLIILILFGGAISYGLLSDLGWEGVLFSIAAIFIIRPISAYCALFKTKTIRKEKIIISFFGIRGIGSFFYLAFALNKHSFPYQNKLWSIIGFTVLLSIILHGASSFFAIRKIEEELEKQKNRT